MSKNFQRWLSGSLTLIAFVGLAPSVVADEAPVLTLELPVTTQGPFWPPSAVVDANGDFVVVGQLLTEVAPGLIIPIPGQAVVSKDTTPPLDAEGREDFSNPFGAAYDVVRPLDLGPGGADRGLALHTASFGPPVGDFGGGPRVPAEGDSPYNLNSGSVLCPEVFPTVDQSLAYTLPSVPIQDAPVWGFQGDGVAHDATTGELFDPYDGSGNGCSPDGCSGENVVDHRARGSVTLGRYLQARGELTITLDDFSEEAGAYTAARFDMSFDGLLPNAVYTVNALRTSVLVPNPLPASPDPLSIPNVILSDADGSARYSTKVTNPFPDPALDPSGLRIAGLVVVFHSDYQNWGACPARLGPGVDVHALFNTAADGTLDMTSFITVAP